MRNTFAPIYCWASPETTAFATGTVVEGEEYHAADTVRVGG